MPSVKPTVERRDVLRVIEEHFGHPASDLQPLEGGEIAQTFAFVVERDEYVIRLNAQVMGATFAKEAYIAHHLASTSVPIPAVVHLGKLGDCPFAITRKAAGRRINTLPPAEVEALLPSLLEVLDAIHGSAMPPAPGYGSFDDHGTGLFPSWRHYLTFVREEEPDWEFYGRWHDLFDRTFLERDVFDRIYARMVRLLEYCPEDHTLVHGGFEYSNILADGGKISAVLDWIDAKYGDGLFDVALLAFWDPRRDIVGRYARHSAEKGLTPPHLAERVLCYQSYLGLDALRFYAKTDQKQGYEWACGRILGLLAD
jgi:hygromycin-B 4-O-kinase